MKDRKKLLAGSPSPRRQCERKMTRSPSCGAGKSPPLAQEHLHAILTGKPTGPAEELNVVFMNFRTVPDAGTH